jgi:hypothetical protein
MIKHRSKEENLFSKSIETPDGSQMFWIAIHLLADREYPSAKANPQDFTSSSKENI